jgi:hypothetical protein
MRNYAIESDFVLNKTITPLLYKQYDNGDTLEVQLYNDTTKIILTTETVLAFFQLKDGTIIQRPCTISTEGNPVVTLNKNVLCYDKQVESEFVIYYDDGKETTTKTILIDVQTSIDRVGGITADPQYDIIQQILNLKGADNTDLEVKITQLNNAVTEQYNKLSAAQQQDSEVIIARKTFANLGARLDNSDSTLANISNPNLLINGDFKIWQRGTDFNNFAIGYVVDRWLCQASAISATVGVRKHDLGMEIYGGNVRVMYRMELEEAKKLNGKTLTYTVQTSTNKSTGQITINTNGISAEYIMVLDFTFAAGTIINYIKLELGSIATPFVPRPYAEELAMCQRYCRAGNFLGSCRALSGTSVHAWFEIPNMRVAPTLSKFTNVSTFAIAGWNTTDLNNLSSLEIGNGYVSMDVSGLSSQTTGTVGAARLDCILDAELY